MNERKFTDDDVIKALRLHSKEGESCLGKCPYANERYCGSKMAKGALDLINRQRAEIERLTVEYAGFRGAANSLKMHYNNARAEAIKEFEDKLKARFFNYYEGLNENTSKSNYHGETLMFYEVADMIEDCIESVVEELTEGKQHG